jgi:metallophosphoesterase superfamily enzyme
LVPTKTIERLALGHPHPASPIKAEELSLRNAAFAALRTLVRGIGTFF